MYAIIMIMNLFPTLVQYTPAECGADTVYVVELRAHIAAQRVAS